MKDGVDEQATDEIGHGRKKIGMKDDSFASHTTRSFEKSLDIAGANLSLLCRASLVGLPGNSW